MYVYVSVLCKWHTGVYVGVSGGKSCSVFPALCDPPLWEPDQSLVLGLDFAQFLPCQEGGPFFPLVPPFLSALPPLGSSFFPGPPFLSKTLQLFSGGSRGPPSASPGHIAMALALTPAAQWAGRAASWRVEPWGAAPGCLRLLLATWTSCILRDRLGCCPVDYHFFFPIAIGAGRGGFIQSLDTKGGLKETRPHLVFSSVTSAQSSPRFCLIAPGNRVLTPPET